MMLLRIFVVTFIALSIWTGISAAKKSFDIFAVSKVQFMKLDGVIEEVRPHLVSIGGNAMMPATSKRYAEVMFSYPSGTNRTISNTATILCTICAPEEVFRLTGKRPSQLVRGETISVYAAASDFNAAYLEKPSASDLLSTLGFAFLWLVIAPVFAHLFYRSWTQDRAS